jgi:serine/threonine protein kinase
MWALGVLLHFMVNGAMPFLGLTASELKRNIRRGEYSIKENLGYNVIRLIDRLLQVDALRRITIKKVMVKVIIPIKKN